MGRDGAEIRLLATPASHTQRIAEAINVMRAESPSAFRSSALRSLRT